ncbi:MAG: kinase/pyrophosphorylase [Desulfobulbus sp.]|jgi:regulator of PEP synthase PpsR (kinase-PPPase family)|uniref:pyruvate, phosphate dikinase/phosphoenolpyruvate synthase regulator n=1 Tax=Desulfobulbus sp. TaxID=895 RepID=UPI0028443ED5|nr:pyruvate, phosphate dikinase/phosphoenolpyruvate synthase regulator [Desulfobulbus sp.]MDR2549212.1 kinase/pyrophosphorylase [Desulfobulbus sp.]
MNEKGSIIQDVYYVSGSTAILAEDMGKALLAQFQGIRFREEKIPFVHTPDDARKALAHILQQSEGGQPLIFCTIMDQETRDVFNCPDVKFFDIFLNTLELLEKALDTEALREPGYSRHFTISKMDKRVDAIHFSLEHDDGTKPAEYDEAEIILIGVSRSGKTPVSIYLATHMELKSANFPLTSDHLDKHELPKEIVRNRKKVIGLTCSPGYLHNIREKRYAGSTYASLANCTKELQQAKQLYQRHNLKVLNVEGRSIEEIAVQAIQGIGLAQKNGRSRSRDIDGRKI